MGLTIHYGLRTSGDAAEAKAKLEKLRQAALDLPVAEVSAIREFGPKDLAGDVRDFPDKDWRWALIQAGKTVEVPGNRFVGIDPMRMIAFRVWPGKGCEEANMGLCQYPFTVVVEGKRIRTNSDGWSWHSFCKTQYASEEGVDNFLRCHLSVVRLLDVAKDLDILDRVNDEGNYWDKRDPKALANDVGEWNSMIAAFGKALSETHPGQVAMPIADHPDFEQLAKAGLKDEKTRKLVELISRTARKA